MKSAGNPGAKSTWYTMSDGIMTPYMSSSANPAVAAAVAMSSSLPGSEDQK